MLEWSIFQGVPERDINSVLEMARRRSFDRGEVVFHEGDPADTLHLIEEGRFAVRISTQYSDEAILSVLGPGDTFGELALLTPGEPRSATVVALEKGKTHSVHQLDFNRLRRRNPSVGDVLISILSAQVRRLSRHLVEALYIPADTRVRRRVVNLTELYLRHQVDADEVTIPLTQDELAGLAGTSRATVNRVLREDEERHLLKLGRGKTVVYDLAGLKQRAALTD